MLSKVYTGTIIGLDAVVIEVEVDVANRGLPSFTIVGLPDKAVDEAKDRVRTAIVNSSFDNPDSKITVNLAPADIPKQGASFDLPIAVGILTAAGVLSAENLGNSIFAGELSLEGKVRRIPGVISLCLMALEKGIETVYIPKDNAEEARIIKGITIYPVDTLTELVLHLNNISRITALEPIQEEIETTMSFEFDFADIKGQHLAKRAFEIAAAGFHNIHIKGPPGAGKTMLSRAFPSILSPLNSDEVLEVSKIYSAYSPDDKIPLIHYRPFRSPHHTTSRNGLIGGGNPPKPGDITLAHNGVLFLDEFPEYPRNVLEALRQPLEDGVISISRAAGNVTFPAKFLMLAASNPCPCGFFGHPTKQCKCMPGAIASYQKRLSGPLLDRIDLHIEVMPVSDEQLTSEIVGESSESIRKRVLIARDRQLQRFSSSKIRFNRDMKSGDIKKYCNISKEGQQMLKQAISRLSLSARSYFKVLKVAQTIADLEGVDEINALHIAESLQYRKKDN